MSRTLFVLVHPSEGKSDGGTASNRRGAFDERLIEPRRHVLEVMSGLLAPGHHESLKKIMQVQGVLLDRAIAALDAVADGRAPVMPAWQRYTGVVWEHLAPSTMSVPQRRRLLVPSGLYGINTGADLIADYRLKMDVHVPALGGVARYWRPHVTGALREHADGAIVANLLPKEHSMAIEWGGLLPSTRVIDVTFLRADGRAAAGHAAKAVKGVLARSLLLQGVRVLAGFEWGGWRAHRDGDAVRVIAPT